MDPVSLASIAVAVVAALSAYASQRAVAKASITNNSTSSRVEMEKEAYDRARAYDTETIARQDKEIKELQADNEILTAEVKLLRSRIARLEVILPADIEEVLRERLREPKSDS